MIDIHLILKFIYVVFFFWGGGPDELSIDDDEYYYCLLLFYLSIWAPFKHQCYERALLSAYLILIVISYWLIVSLIKGPLPSWLRKEFDWCSMIYIVFHPVSFKMMCLFQRAMFHAGYHKQLDFEKCLSIYTLYIV